VQVSETPRIDQDMFRLTGEAFDRAAHRQQTCPIDVDGVDLLDVSEAETPALSLISAASRFRSVASSFFESSMPGIREAGANMTTAAATGPASGLMPASSTPATRITPRFQRELS
jgi:hypothetical protein